MSLEIQDTLLQLFEQVRQDVDTIPTVPIDEWQEGSAEWQLLTSFNSMLEQLQQRTLQLMRTEQELREREEQYRSIFEATLDGLTISDLETGIIVETNPANYGMFGYTYEEMIGLSPSDVVPPDYLPLVGKGLQTIKAGGRNDLVMVAQRKDGTRFPVEVHSTLFTYKGKPHLLSVSRDITEQVESEQQMREREEQYRSIFEATYDGLVINDLDGFCVEANPTYCRMLGYMYEEIIGLHYSKTTFPEYYPMLDENSRSIRAGVQFQAQGLARRKDGSSLPVEALSIPFTYKGKPHMLGVMRDITERVQAEQQLREKEEQYRSIFEATTDGLIIRNMNGAVVQVNPAACKMHGYSYEEYLALSRDTLIHPDYHPQLREIIQTVKAGKTFQGQAVDLRKDGSTFPVEFRSDPFTYLGQPHMLTVLRDITERIEAERQLREREEQYRSIFEATSDGLIIRNMDGFVVEANPAAYIMHGYTYEEFIGLHRTDIIAPEDHSMVAEYMKAIQAGRTFRGQAIDLRKDGTAFPVEVRGSLFTYLGKPHTLSVLRDVTERVQAEQQLREKEEQYRSVFEATTDGLIIIDLEDSRAVEANPRACQMFGYTYEEMLGRHVGLNDTTQEPPVYALDVIRAGGFFQMRETATGKDGTWFNAEVHATPFTYKGKPHMLAIVRDITEQVQAEQELREKEEQYRSIFEATNDALFIMDLEDGHIVEANPAACDIYGYSYEELIGLPPSAVIHPDKLPGLVEVSLPLIRAGGRRHVQGVNLRKDGSAFPIDLHQTAFTYQGKPHILSVMRDITEQVQAQQLLEQRVEERTRELSTLLEVSHNVASTLELQPLLGLILDQLKSVADYAGSSLLTLESGDFVIVDNRGSYPTEQVARLRFPIKDMKLIWEVISRGEPLIIDDVWADTPLGRDYRQVVGDLLETTFPYIHAWMIIPLMLKEKMIGVFTLSSREPGYFTQRHATLALAIANQAAIAIENARLYEQAQELAAVEERQRLARELHDSVSQALYGISLGVHTARLQVDHNPGELAESLDYVLELAEAALTEMRALIFELRPESLEAEGLITALTKQAAAMQARHGINVELDLCNEPDVPLKIKRELYRVAQEAVHNTVKHAEAGKVDLRLHMVDGAVILEVHDDGKGFEATGSFPGHLGLHSMRERIEGLDGGLEIESAPGQGTSIRAHIPVRKTTTLNGG